MVVDDDTFVFHPESLSGRIAGAKDPQPTRVGVLKNWKMPGNQPVSGREQRSTRYTMER